MAFQFNPIAKKQFQQRRLYSRLLLQIQAPIKSGHALTLYEYLNDELQRQKERIEKMPLALADLRALLDIDEDQYTEFKYLNQRAIKPAFKEINECTDIEASCVFIRKNRSVVALSINAKRQKNYIPSLNLEPTDLSEKFLKSPEDIKVELLTAYGITKNKADDLAVKFSVEELTVGLKYTLERHSENKVKNIPSYLIKAINEGYGSVLNEDEKDKKLNIVWAEHKNSRALKLFEALPLDEQQALKSSYVDGLESNSRTFARDKFRYEGEWNSYYIKNDFKNKIMLSLLNDPIDIDFESFKEWWAQQELKNLLAEAQKKAKSI